MMTTTEALGKGEGDESHVLVRCCSAMRKMRMYYRCRFRTSRSKIINFQFTVIKAPKVLRRRAWLMFS